MHQPINPNYGKSKTATLKSGGGQVDGRYSQTDPQGNWNRRRGEVWVALFIQISRLSAPLFFSLGTKPALLMPIAEQYEAHSAETSSNRNNRIPFHYQHNSCFGEQNHFLLTLAPILFPLLLEFVFYSSLTNWLTLTLAWGELSKLLEV